VNRSSDGTPNPIGQWKRSPQHLHAGCAPTRGQRGSDANRAPSAETGHSTPQIPRQLLRDQALRFIQSRAPPRRTTRSAPTSRQTWRASFAAGRNRRDTKSHVHRPKKHPHPSGTGGNVIDRSLENPCATCRRLPGHQNPRCTKSFGRRCSPKISSLGLCEQRPIRDRKAALRHTVVDGGDDQGRIQPVIATLNSPTIQRRPPLVSSTLAFYEGGR
jgi:hypothetical protein